MTTWLIAITRLELRQLGRSPSLVAGVVLLCGASLFAAHHGRTVIDRQRAALARSPSLQADQHRSILSTAPAEANGGDQLYYLFFHTAHEPSRWAPVSLGQRDLQPFNLKIRLLALQGQIYDSEIGNPLLAALGAFDLAFVLVFIVPLFVIGLTHNVWSAEREHGTWVLVRSQPVSAVTLLILKLAVRSGAVLLPVLVTLGLTAWTLRLPPDSRMLAVVLLVTAYVALWTGAVLLVNAVRRSSDFNFVALLTLWIFWCILGPAVVNAVASLRYPLSEGLELTVRARQGYHRAWDIPVQETMSRFYEHYPEWKGAPVPRDRYSNAWYYAMQQRGDDEAAPAVAAYHDGLVQRLTWTQRVSVLFPPAVFQTALNAIARTDLDSHLAYLRSVGEYHEALKRYFLPVAFNGTAVAKIDWAGAPVHRFADERPVSLLGGAAGATLAALTVVVVLMGTIAIGRSRRETD
jgi:ABC-2 type transport system permease protein